MKPTYLGFKTQLDLNVSRTTYRELELGFQLEQDVPWPGLLGDTLPGIPKQFSASSIFSQQEVRRMGGHA